MFKNLMACTAFAVTLLGLSVWGHQARAQSNPAFIPFGSVSKGALYRPDSGPAPHVAIIVMHRTSNFMTNPACKPLAAHGFMVLCMNSRYDNNDILVNFEPVALDVKKALEFLRKQPGITKVLLFGHSGGGSTMSFYQAVAENGVAYCQDPKRLTKCKDDLAGLPKADGLILADAHPGEPEQLMRGMNPSYAYDPKTGETRIDATLDPFDPKNGYNPKGASNYSADFQARYFAAQAQEMNGLIAKVQAGLKRKGYFNDDGLLMIPGAGNPAAGDSGRAFLFVMDTNIAGFGTSLQPHKLLRNDGTIVTEIIHSVKVPNLLSSGKTPDPVKLNRAFETGTKLYTYKAFLSTDAMHATNSLDGIDYCTSNDSAACALPSISTPLLMMTMQANDFVRDNEKMFASAKSQDKDYVVIEGATHNFQPCLACETTPGEYANATKNMFDYVAAWINKRY